MEVWIGCRLDSAKSSQHNTGDENEQDAQSRRCEKGDQCSDEGTLVEQLSDIGFANWCPVHESVFTVAQERHDGIDLVLVGDNEVCSDSKWKNNLD